MATRFRRLYGSGPLHLLALIASFAIAGFAVSGWFERSSDVGAVLVWFLAAIVGHDLVLLPLYSLLDRIAFGRGSQPAVRPAVPGGLYIRIPTFLSTLLLLVFFPEIFRLGDDTFKLASGMTQAGYLARWLAATGVMFALSALAYAVALGRARRGATVGKPSPRRAGSSHSGSSRNSSHSGS
jgi:hypothetical protein